MEYQKITKILGSKLDKVPKFITKKWIDVYDQSGGTYNTNKEKIIVTKGENNNDNNNAYDKKLALKNNAPFISCISMINGKLIENAEDLDIVMPTCNLFEYSKNFRKTTGSLFHYYRDEPNSGTEGDGDDMINYSIKNSKSFNYETSITGKLEGND